MVGGVAAATIGAAGDHIQTRLTDPWFRSPRREVVLDPKVELILIDDRTLERLKAPTVFWAGQFARLLSGLLQARVRAVGLDWLPYEVNVDALQAVQHLYPELKSAGGEPWLPLAEALQAYGDEKLGTAPVVQGVYPPNFNGDDTDPRAANAQYRAPDVVLDLLSKEQFGFLNFSKDSDAVLRSQVVVPLQVQHALWRGVKEYFPFAVRLAEFATGQHLEVRNSQWNGHPVESDEVSLPVCFPPHAGGFQTRSFVDVLNASPSQRKTWYEGKVVLVGPGSRVFQDYVHTPIGPVLGVETHGFMVNQLLTDQFIRTLPGWGSALLLSVALAAASSAGLFAESIVGLGIFCLLLASSWFGLRELFIQKQILSPVLALGGGAAVSYLVAALCRARLRSRIEKQIRQLFGRYVSPDVMETLLRHPEQAALGATARRHITVLFSDINGFSGHSEQKTPEKIMAMLNRYFESMNRIIFQHNGTIKQFVGDEIMAMYGAPLPHTEPEVAAVRTALEMTRELQRQHASDPHEEDGFYLIKVGIHCGNVILGNVGSADRTEYAAVGDDVNLGSRIMGMTKTLQADILISGEVYEKVKHLSGVRFVDKGRHPVKGRKESVAIYAVYPEEDAVIE